MPAGVGSQPGIYQTIREDKDMGGLSLEQAETIIDAGFEKGREIGCNPLAIAVLDDGGNLTAFKKQDNSSVMRFEIAFGKAWGAIGMGISSRILEQRAVERPHFVQALTAAAGGRVVPVAGGLVVFDGDGRALGSVGVTGDSSDRDEECALAGIEAAGLKSSAG
jgi:uncharacterized protein GlcG (DUF336 family)